MLIYKIPNFAQNKVDYVCDSQETINAIPVIKKLNKPLVPSDWCIIGTNIDANRILILNQQSWLTQQTNIFTVNLQTAVEDGVIWSVVNLSTEPQNTDKNYFILNPTTGLYTNAIGLSAAQDLFVETQKKYLEFINMNNYITMTSWT